MLSQTIQYLNGPALGIERSVDHPPPAIQTSAIHPSIHPSMEILGKKTLEIKQVSK